MVLRDSAATCGFLTKSPPKLTGAALVAISSISDAASALYFKTEHPDAWHALVLNPWVDRDTFWQLLLALAKPVARAAAGDKPDIGKTTMVLSEAGHLYRVFKVLPLGDGGFSVSAPYHKARMGSSIKIPQASQTGSLKMFFDVVVPFYSSDRVKFSYHPDGFVQFSSEEKGKNLSGRDRHTREPQVIRPH
jgi:hypothetical protein